VVVAVLPPAGFACVVVALPEGFACVVVALPAGFAWVFVAPAAGLAWPVTAPPDEGFDWPVAAPPDDGFDRAAEADASAAAGVPGATTKLGRCSSTRPRGRAAHTAAHHGGVAARSGATPVQSRGVRDV